MQVRVRLFARYREAVGRERLDVDVPDGGTVEAAWAAVVDRHPELAAYRPFTLFAVGQDYVHSEHPLRAGDELCLFPPVSGGSEAGDLYEVVDHPLSADAITAAVDHPGAGGVVVFSGVVRDETDGRPVKYLEYEAHPPMAEAKMQTRGLVFTGYTSGWGGHASGAAGAVRWQFGANSATSERAPSSILPC